MNLTRVPSFRSLKLAFLFVFGLSIFASFTNVTTKASAPAPVVVAEAVNRAAATLDPDYIPADVPSSGDHQIDLIILHAAEQSGVDPRLLHAVIHISGFSVLMARTVVFSIGWLAYMAFAVELLRSNAQ